MNKFDYEIASDPAGLYKRNRNVIWIESQKCRMIIVGITAKYEYNLYYGNKVYPLAEIMVDK